MKNFLIIFVLVSLLIPSLVLAEEERLVIGSYVDLSLKVNELMYAVTVNGNNVQINYLTTQFTSSTVLITNLDTGETILVEDEQVVTYHTILTELESGNYSVQPLAGDSQGEVENIVIE